MSVYTITPVGLVIDGEPLVPTTERTPSVLHRIDPDTIEAEAEVAPIERLVQLIRAEADTLADYLPEAQAVQWLPTGPIVTEPGKPSDPTGETVADPGRLALRLQVIRSERLLRETAVALIGVRRGLEMALDARE